MHNRYIVLSEITGENVLFACVELSSLFELRYDGNTPAGTVDFSTSVRRWYDVFFSTLFRRPIKRVEIPTSNVEIARFLRFSTLFRRRNCPLGQNQFVLQSDLQLAIDHNRNIKMDTYFLPCKIYHKLGLRHNIIWLWCEASCAKQCNLCSCCSCKVS